MRSLVVLQVLIRPTVLSQGQAYLAMKAPITSVSNEKKVAIPELATARMYPHTKNMGIPKKPRMP